MGQRPRRCLHVPVVGRVILLKAGLTPTPEPDPESLRGERGNGEEEVPEGWEADGVVDLPALR